MIHLFLALTNPLPGREGDFNQWYDNHHLREVLRYGNGFTGGRRYKLHSPRIRSPADKWTYLALYALESDDLAYFHRHAWIENRPPLTPFTGLLADDHVAWVYTPAAPAVGSMTASTPTDSQHLLFLFGASDGGTDEKRPAIIDTDSMGASAARGLRGAQRYELSPHQREHQARSPWQQLELYALDPSLDAPALDSLLLAASLPIEMARSNNPTATPPTAWLFTAVGDPIARRDL